MTIMLIVEDDPAWRSLYTLEFGRQFEVYEANDGLQALSIVEDVRPDIILLDLRLPRMDGRTFLEWLERRGIRTPVVVCSGALPEGDPAMVGVHVAPKSADLRYVRSTVRAVLQASGGGPRPAAEPEGDDATEWLD
jgi:DNA-binding response OmpR family regulator